MNLKQALALYSCLKKKKEDGFGLSSDLAAQLSLSACVSSVLKQALTSLLQLKNKERRKIKQI
jgi:hypothetical protein